MSKSNIKPFKMHENIYFVGSTRVSVHVIDTEEGLVVIDTGYPDMYEQILDSFNELGLDPKNICAIFHSHGHIDHFGCTGKLKALSGAKTYISYIDNDIVNGKKDLSWANELGYERLPAFNCDVLLNDGDVVTFSNTSIKCVLTPGHTEGVLSFFINVKTNDGEFVAAMHGGTGLNTLTEVFLNRHKMSFDVREVFRESLHKVYDEHVDLVLGNHPEQNDTEGKSKKVLEGKSILDSSEWKQLLINTEQYLDEQIARGF